MCSCSCVRLCLVHVCVFPCVCVPVCVFGLLSLSPPKVLIPKVRDGKGGNGLVGDGTELMD